MSRIISAFLLTLGLIGLLCGKATAHRLNIYAWLDNDRIVVDCNFGENRPALNAAVNVLDGTDRKILATGQTDQRGQVAFAVPDVVREGHSLIMEVNAGQGHHNEWTMNASEIYQAASLAAGFEQAAIAAQANDLQTGQHDSKPLSANLPSNPQTQLTTEEIRSIVHQSLEAHLAPIRKEIAASKAAGPTLVEIIGGIGWILGLVGIALYFKSRHA